MSGLDVPWYVVTLETKVHFICDALPETSNVSFCDMSVLFDMT